jgi:hypothetical protein
MQDAFVNKYGILQSNNLNVRYLLRIAKYYTLQYIDNYMLGQKSPAENVEK